MAAGRLLKLAGAALAALLVFLAIAWWHGGREPMRPITYEIDVPGTLQ